MKKNDIIKIILCVIIFTLESCGSFKMNIINSEGQKTGKWVELTSTGYIQFINYKYGKKHGASYIYDNKDGYLIQKLKYKNDKKNGFSINYWSNGKVSSEIKYINDSIVSTKVHSPLWR